SKETSGESGKTGEGIAINVAGIDVSDANLVWDDRKAGKHYELSGLNFTTGTIATDEPVPVSVEFKLTSTTPAQTFTVTLDSRITANADLNRFVIADLAATLAAAGEGLPGGGLDLGLNANVALDKAAGTLAVSDLVLSGPNLDLSGALTGKDLNGKPSFAGNFKLAESNLKQLMALGGTAPVTADPDALTRISAEFGVAATANSAALKPFTVTLDDSTFSGDFSVTSFDGPAMRFALKLDEIDLDRYLPPKSDTAPEAATATANAPGPADPLAALRPLDLGGTIGIGALKLANLRTTNIAVTLKSAHGVLDIKPIAADLYSGKIAGGIRIDATQAEPRIAIDNRLSGVQIGPLLKDFADNEKLQGTGAIDVALNLRGLTPEPIKRSLNGTIAVSLNDGIYKGVDVIETLCSVSTKLDQLLTGASGELNQSGDTAFSAMSMSVNFTDGVATSDDLDVKSPLLRVNGAGGANLFEETLDYLVQAELVSACEGQAGAAADQLVGVPLPIRARGTFAEPKISPDWAALGKELAQSGVKDKAETLIKDKLKIPGIGGLGGTDAETATDAPKDVGGALKDGLKKLF
ncbi:MAG: AsmA family protein, partial [Gammaproteobacteria bacterium]